MHTHLSHTVIAACIAVVTTAQADDGADPGSDLGELPVELLTAPFDRPSWEISVGADYSRGTYGAATATEVAYLPFGATYRRGRFSLSVNSGYLKVDGPVDYASILGLSPEDLAALDLATESISVSGFADTAVAARYGIGEIIETGTFIDVGARVKLPTASRVKGLGTGKVAVDVHTDITQLIGRWSVLLSGSYGIRSRGNGGRNTWTVSAGLGRALSDRLAVGAVFDWRTSAYRGGRSAREVMAYASYELSDRVSVTGYAITGFSRASVDQEAGIRLSYRWN